MSNPKIKNKQGFTIIEVVLVLAIAALIFLMVFIALPALQRNQRDTQRKNDLGRAMTAVNNYQSNNRGKLPETTDTEVGAFTNTGDDGFIQKYLTTNDDEFQDPSEGEDYVFVYNSTDLEKAPTWDDNPGEIFVNPDSTCGDDGKINTNAGTRKIALRMALEGGGVYCQSN